MELDSQVVSQTLATQIGNAIDEKVSIIDVQSLSGGSINTAVKIKTNCGDFFAKYNVAKTRKDMFKLEAQNLALLAETRTVKTPNVIANFESEGMEYLVLDYIDSGTPHYDFWSDLGFGLAHLHKTHQDYFGLDFDNYIGSVPQSNKKSDKWTDFFIESRLEPMLKMAVDNERTDPDMITRFERLFQKLPEIFPSEESSLLHGDLWSGNCMSDENGDPIVYDPATYYGNREMDIAMTKLFGGFEDEFYSAYNEEFPLQPEWEHRVQICNLYPLMVHVNLFGGAYIQAVKNTVNNY